MTTRNKNMSGLEVKISSEPNGVTVAATGDVDLYTIGMFEPEVIKGISDLVCEPNGHGLTIDLTHVDFIDSCGLAVLLKARNLTKEDSRNFKIVLTRDTQPARVLKLGRFESHMALQYLGD